MRGRMYEIYDGEMLIGKLSAEDAAKIIGTTIKCVYTAASGGYRLKRRYSIVPADDECMTKSITQELCREWDKTRLKILHKGRATI